ncbi:MAG: hypothetical protein AB3N16_09535 [Flavobacteriaceae bacterium]
MICLLTLSVAHAQVHIQYQFDKSVHDAMEKGNGSLAERLQQGKLGSIVLLGGELPKQIEKQGLPVTISLGLFIKDNGYGGGMIWVPQEMETKLFSGDLFFPRDLFFPGDLFDRLAPGHYKIVFFIQSSSFNLLGDNPIYQSPKQTLDFYWR